MKKMLMIFVLMIMVGCGSKPSADIKPEIGDKIQSYAQPEHIEIQDISHPKLPIERVITGKAGVCISINPQTDIRDISFVNMRGRRINTVLIQYQGGVTDIFVTYETLK